MINILPKNGKAYLIKTDLGEDYTPEYFLKNLEWRKDKIKIFGKTHLQPRLVAWYGNPGVEYTYSGIKMKANPWTSELKRIKSKIEQLAQYQFNSVLINLYRNGQDYMGWHCDDETELGEKPIIASLSLGEKRDFFFRYKKDHNNKIKLNLEDGDLLIMKGETQQYWQHAIPKRLKINAARINLTFRYIN